MKLRFWGVRGSIPTPHVDRLRYGGNTTCLEIDAGHDEELVLIDCGSGLRALGEELTQRPKIRRVHILMTHFHWDHIQGLPYFPPLFHPDVDMVFYSSHPPDRVRGLLQVQMADPFFPVPFASIPSNAEFRHVEIGRPFSAGVFRADAFTLRHPQGCIGYRLNLDGRILVHASDHEHGDPGVDAGVVRTARNAEMLVMDAQYTPEEYLVKVGWGHSSIAHAAEVAHAADVARLVLFHHDPMHNDAFLDGMLDRARELYPSTDMACENTVFEVDAARQETAAIRIVR
ncbi:MAG TPA: MBL fold metallo-hydrolase [Terracidiphilus sp.]|nr:MBL fold metallo-hydrolase [Acidobacteriaceae bacterium]HTX74997.1 MBL fold metallo-hydrolase [Terracidiphilus sp.]